MPTKLLKLAFAGLVALSATACRDQPVDPTLRLSVRGTTLSIKIENRTAAELVAGANFLDRSRPQELALRVYTERGNPVPPCNDVAYVDGPDLRTIAPGTAQTIEVDVSTVMDTHCLEGGRPYRLQAVLVGGAQPGVPVDFASNEIIVTLNAPAAE